MIPIKLNEKEGYNVVLFCASELDFFDMADTTQAKLLEAFSDEMPYDIMKARTGDPDVWIANRFDQMGKDAVADWIVDNLEDGIQEKYRQVINNC